MSSEKNNPAFGSGQNPNPSQDQNPNYYGDEAHAASPSELHGNAPPPQYSDPTSAHPGGQPDQQYYPPPPPGPPPNQSGQPDQQYYPPPPPGPPPIQNSPNQSGHPLQSHPVNAPPPSYESHGEPGLSVPYGDEKAPNLPPRPASGQGHQVPYFPPPPGQEESGSAPPAEQVHVQGGAAAPGAAMPPSGSSSYTPGTGAYALGSQSAAMGGFAAATGSPAASAAAAAMSAGSGAGAGADAPAAESTTAAAADGKAEKKKTGFGERLYQWGIKAGVPVNKITNKLGSEAFWPTTMDKECDKAARILKSFCKDGFYTTPSDHPPPSPGHPSTPGPKSEAKTLVKIPVAAIQRAKGLAIFTTFRTGFHFSGASGSGIVVSRLPDGSWSPPVGFLVHTLGAGFMVGLDIYDSVCVLNTDDAVRAFTKPRLSLGGEIAVVAGPVGAGKALEAAVGAGKPVWSYMKSRGFYAGIQADGTVIIQRPAANAAFYGDQTITPERILKGDVQPAPAAAAPPKDGELVMWPAGGRQLMEILKNAEGKKADEKIVGEVGSGPTPGDLASTEGVPNEPVTKEGEMQGGTTRYA